MDQFYRAKKYLKQADPIMAKLVKSHKLTMALGQKSDHFLHLVGSIISQQLSTKVADVIWGRFIQSYKVQPTPRKVLNTPDEKLRAIGLSYQKISYIKNLSLKLASKQLNIERLAKLDDALVIEHLTTVKGIGKWTAEMFLMFALNRPDIFSHGDLGLRNAIKKLYKLRGDPSVNTIERISGKWSPYRSVACRYLWLSLDNAPGGKVKK